MLLMLCLPALANASSDRDGVLQRLQGLDKENTRVVEVSALAGEGDDQMRLRAMREAAISVGAQHGYNEYMGYLKGELETISADLDALFPFRDLMRLEDNGQVELYLLPPVVREVKDVTRVNGEHTELTTTGTLLAVDKPARLVTTPPDWREYVFYDQAVDISDPPSVLLPESDKEKQAWAAWVLEGWSAGVEQADIEMKYRLRRLGSDFIGMAKYLRLVSENKAYKATVVSQSVDVHGDSNRMAIEQRVYKLHDGGGLQLDASDWKAVPLDNRESYRLQSEFELREAY
ncbi:type IV secretory system conjugative DNA transfer family protein [Ferrimonas marina]|nr:type IV secretory system conjugative DNA transfer family protein [Ferrimonas marina]